MASLTITNNSASNPQTLDLTKYMNVQRDAGMDVSDPAFTEKVWARSLLKEGATLALETLHEKELVFPLGLNATTLSAVLAQIQEINQIVTTPGATCSWQPDGASQATTFDILSGQVDVEYDFRREGQKWTAVKLRIFTAPLGRAGGPRALAAASGIGPLLMITPYASDGSLAIGASTQAGISGFGGRQQASGGVFYAGNPSLAGDAPAQLVMTYTGSPSAPNLASVSMLSLLPGPSYWPERPLSAAAGATSYPASVVGGTIWQFRNAGSSHGGTAFLNVRIPVGAPPIGWAGQHRLMVLARASGGGGALFTETSVHPAVQYPTTASIPPSDQWNFYDLGTFGLRASEIVPQFLSLGAAVPSVFGGGSTSSVDVCAAYMLPDATTWFLGGSTTGAVQSPDIVFVDGTRNAQFAQSWLSSFKGAPSPQSITQTGGGLACTAYSRGVVPLPDPKNAVPILAVLAGNAATGGSPYPSQLMSAQVQVVERTRYVLP